MWEDVLEIGPECHELFIDLIKAPEIADLEIQLAGVSTLAGYYRVGRINPINHTLFYTREGQGKLHTNNGEYLLDKWSLVTLPAGEPFLIELDSKAWSIVWMDLCDTPRWSDICRRRPTFSSNQNPEYLFHLLKLIYLEDKSSMRKTIMQLIEFHLLETLNASTNQTKDHQRIETLFHAVEKQLHYTWTIENMCDRIHYSAPHLHRLCLNRFGRSPVQQVIYLRIERAKYLLLHSSWSIDQIANHVGYNDIFSFSKRFKKSVGNSPSQYRKQ
ncbi:MAG: AraC-like DNA-binding protein [Colwellia sp.]|jgi:AraC-like DNA-binding protein